MIFFDRKCLENRNMNIFLWGTGYVANQIIKKYKQYIINMNIVGVIDNNELKRHNQFYGYNVYSPDILLTMDNCFVIVLCEDKYSVVEQIKLNYYNNVCKCEDYYYFVKYRFLSRYENTSSIEKKEIVDYVSDRSLSTFNYKYVEKYRDISIKILFDEEKKLFYAIQDGKRMYFNKRYEREEQVYNYLKSILIEQDMESPHCYAKGYSEVKNGDVVIDAGAAEGFFSLSVIDKVKMIYILEPDEDWLEALYYTFEPYKDRVRIVGKYLSDYNSDETITLDELCDDQVDFLKMDIEGEEYNALIGGVNLINHSENIVCAICTYHNELDYNAIDCFFKNSNMETKASKGYMWFSYDKDYLYSLPSLRRGLIYARKMVID